MFRPVIFLFLSFFFFIQVSMVSGADINDRINVRTETDVGDKGGTNDKLDTFIGPIQEFFFTAPVTGGEGLTDAFIAIAFQIKNFFIGIAVIFLIFGVLKLLFSQAGEEDIKKWRGNIIWVSVGVFVMQLSFSVWKTLILKDPLDKVNGSFGYLLWTNVFAPIVSVLQMLAAFGFIIMMFYSFYIIVTGGGDEEKLKKGKNIVIYSLVGFFLIKLPESIIRAIYGSPSSACNSLLTISTCDIEDQDLPGGVGIIADIFKYFNGFLAILCVILIIYAGWLVLISGGDEEKLKKAKHIILYIIVGFVILVASHSIFRFFILAG